LTKCVKQFWLGIAINKHFECSVFRGISGWARSWIPPAGGKHSHYLDRQNWDQRRFKVESNFKHVC